jgi:hypothetical protein|uniref:Uncharacterized protein n=1 Tax=Desulfobacca acetoxidans TaxID=60893 RepID=A0A7V6A5J3_9BACT
MGKRYQILVMAGLTLGGLGLMGSPAGAQTYSHPYATDPYTFDQRQEYQQQRIQQGIESGALTPGEARYLERQQGRIDAAEDRMRADGRLSPRERQRLNQMQNQAARDIYRLDHNHRTAENWNGNHNGWGDHWNSGWDHHADRGWYGHRDADWYGRPYDPRYDYREDRQQSRIQHGIHTGELSPGEARYLERQQGHIQRIEDRMRADGRLSPWERQRLNQMQNRASRDIYRLEHNGRPDARSGDSQAGWQGRGYGPQGANSGSYGTTPSGAPVTGAISSGTSESGASQAWQGASGNLSGTAPGGTTTNGATTSGPAPSGTTSSTNTRSWQANRYGGNGYTPNNAATASSTAAGGPQGWQGNYARQGQPGAFRPPSPQAAHFGQPGPWQGQPRFQQQARAQFTPNMMRPNGNFMARPTAGLTGRVNAAGFWPRRR